MGLKPVSRSRPRLAGCTRLGAIPQEAAGGFCWASTSLTNDPSSSKGCRLGVSSAESLFQKRVAFAALFRAGSGSAYPHRQLAIRA